MLEYSRLPVRREVASLIAASGVFGYAPPDNPVVFKCGIRAPLYCNLRKLPLTPQWRPIMDLTLTELRDGVGAGSIQDFNTISGVPDGARDHAAALGILHGYRVLSVPKRVKDHGVKFDFRSLPPGDTILVVEDTSTTSDSLLEFVQLLR